ncbi:MAG: RagB/SusD family nutrient uptake outer membrane protein [Bacteroidales bacterium]|nr:RagB/SusD family nutrient uptake outer membrane protein [Bacteroidales bacterium]
MKRFIVIPALAALAVLASCSLLEENPRSSLPEEEAITSEKALYLNTLGDLYRQIGSSTEGEGIAGTYRGIYDLNTFTTDEAIIPTRGGDWYDGGLWQRLFLHTWETSEAPVKNAWNYLYTMVVLSTEAIVELKDSPEWQAEARALRAYFYYYIMDLFGNVPVLKEPGVSISEVKQSPRAEVFRFIVDELEAVADKLPAVMSQHRGEYYGRFTLPVAMFLLEKLYLNAPVYTGEEHWDKVLSLARSLEGFGYSLSDSYSDNFRVYNESSEENIFVIPLDKHLYPAQNQYIFRSLHYDHASAMGFTAENGSSATPEVLDANAFGTEDEDPRFAMNYWGGVPVDAYGREIDLEYKPRSIALDLTGSPDEKTAGARMRKYQTDYNAFKDGKLMDNDWVVFRYADVLLMKAEALLHTAEEDEALSIVNEVRFRAGAPDLEILTFDILLEERLREFAWEGLRRQDLVRFGRFGAASTLRPQLPGEASSRYTDLFPIPADIRELAPSLEQNPGY